MINEDLTSRIKCVLGFRYTSQILEYLNKKRIYNTQGKAFSRAYITHVVNGIREELRIEEAIIELCDEKIKTHKNLLHKKNELLRSE
ncbi:hypothetical protein [Myroides marinus]|uniref:hypothetical protein n=1 Tax=Myroides marinus TaxID=703342 RepID=UPI00257686F4|nr:hypothetical protein [Myroides marinus]MDM1378197.1 hypothetical protein [Myroides marinus]MDM1385417.1 hypothetical protein [Myroides marinus]MDM1392630.1 hypothetical protein [Myroides marinus]